MSITDELRTWLKSLYTPNSVTVKDEGERIADRIDAEHERLCSRSRSNGYNDGFTDGFNDIESWVVDHEDEMAEHGWVKLPKDTDGEPIHIGDVMDGVNKYDTLQEVTGTVTTISFDATLDPNDSTSVGIRVWADDHKSYRVIYIDPYASVYRHHKHPTVEDVLEELLLEYDRDDSEVTIGEIIERFAAKLQLRGDE